MTDNSKRTGAAIEAHYQFIAWLVPNGPVISSPAERMPLSLVPL
jgi:hypothetical protein